MTYLKVRLQAPPMRTAASNCGTEAVAIVSVDSDDENSSRNQASHYLRSQKWTVAAVEKLKQVASLDDVRYDGRLMKLYLQAEKYGFGCLLLAPILGWDKPDQLCPHI